MLPSCTYLPTYLIGSKSINIQPYIFLNLVDVGGSVKLIIISVIQGD